LRIGLKEGGRGNFALPLFCVTARNDAVVGVDFGRADHGPQNEPALGNSIGRADGGG
jgi:hypothetical protein